jgi:hypothetical protein
LTSARRDSMSGRVAMIERALVVLRYDVEER